MKKGMFTIGYDIGTSFVKASLMDDAGNTVGSVSVPDVEVGIKVEQEGWAEQHPEDWWQNVVDATHKLKAKTSFASGDVKAVGITYQMHGLVLVDKDQQVIRPSIIWCDSRAVEIGNAAFDELGSDYCLENFLNSPGNFTASKLKWVQENEPEKYQQIHKAMLPGDFISMKMSGEINTTVSGLSEGIFWNFKDDVLASDLLEHYKIDKELIPDIVPTFGEQGRLNSESADLLGLDLGTVITYRAGDQPNNAFSLNVLKPGEIAATAGTSGVIYGVGDKAKPDLESRVNTFAHVNHEVDSPRYGTLLCVNGTGILNSWLRKSFSQKTELSYEEMNQKAGDIAPGSQGLNFFPFGNGAERILNNRSIQASAEGLNFNIHTDAHMFRAAQEGIVNALYYGFQIMRDMGINATVVRAGDANMFLSPVFRDAFVNTTGCVLELYNTDGSLGAARGAAVGAGIFGNLDDAFESLTFTSTQEPDKALMEQYQNTYANWLETLQNKIR